MNRVLSINDITDKDIDLVGKIGAKGANIVKMKKLGLNVPEAFFLTTGEFVEFLERNNILAKVRNYYASEIDMEELGEYESELEDDISNGDLDSSFTKNFSVAFETLRKTYESVAVRSSATCEDNRRASFAGQFQTFLFVDDFDTLLNSIRRCWASLYRASAVLYAIRNGINFPEEKMGVVLQGMIDAEKAGVMFTKNPNGDEGEMIIELSTGVGEKVVSGEVVPATLVVDKSQGSIVSRTGDENLNLADDVLDKLISTGKKIENYFDSPSDVEWALEKGDVYVLQSRPITV